MLGAIALTLTLLYWLAEALRIFDHDLGVDTTTTLPAVIHDGPPPGVHMPGPSWRPFLGAFGMFALFLGLVFGGWLLTAGIIALIATLVGWLGDAVKEYREVVRADTTGHLENPPAGKTPSLLFGSLVVLIAIATVLQLSAFAIGEVSGGTGGPIASEAPGGHRRARWLARRVRRPPPASGPPAAVTRRGQGHPVRREVVHGPGGQAVRPRLRQPGRRRAPQHPDQGLGRRRPSTRARSSTASRRRSTTSRRCPPARYTYVCDVHPTMTGTATLQ